MTANKERGRIDAPSPHAKGVMLDAGSISNQKADCLTVARHYLDNVVIPAFDHPREYAEVLTEAPDGTAYFIESTDEKNCRTYLLRAAQEMRQAETTDALSVIIDRYEIEVGKAIKKLGRKDKRGVADEVFAMADILRSILYAKDTYENDETHEGRYYDMNDLTDIDADNDTPEQDAPPLTDTDPLDADILNAGGMVGTMARHIYETAKKPQPWFAIASALAFLGTLFGRKVRTSDGNRTNLYALLLGDAGCGKNYPQTLPQALAHRALADYLIGGEITSDAALYALLNENPSRLLVLDEIGHFIEAAKAGAKSGSPVGSVISALIKLATSANTVYQGKSYANRRERPTTIIDQPCVSFIGSTTPAQLFGTLDAKDIETGFLPRILVFPSVKAEPRNLDETPLTPNMVEYVKSWCAYKRDEACANFKEVKPTIIPYTQQANDFLWAFTKKCEATRDKALADDNPAACIWGRAAEMARRVALILAASRYTPDQLAGTEITDADAKYAIWLIDTITRRTCDQIGKSLFHSYAEREKMKMLEIIKATGRDGISKNTLTRKTQWVRDERTRNAYVKDLIDAGLVSANKVGASVHFRAR